jgi:predicted adenine nucleotide alpha hydrolase (AANH) superfamily ATPase
VKNCVKTAKTIYPEHELHKTTDLREYDFSEFKEETPVFTARCVKGIGEIFADMSRSEIYRAAVVTHIGVIVTLMAGCGLPKFPPDKYALEQGEGWLISMSSYLWQKGSVFEIVGKLEKKPRLLLHSCCAPCSSAVLERLTPDYDVTVFFYNPNIIDPDEYKKRLSEQKRFLTEAYGFDELIEGEYRPEVFKEIIRGLEHLPENKERCKKCYALRLGKTAEIAESGGFGFFTTTLTLSSKKNAGDINAILAAAAEERGVEAIQADFKKNNGYNRSIELSNEYGLYRQSYCGCGL